MKRNIYLFLSFFILFSGSSYGATGIGAIEPDTGLSYYDKPTFIDSKGGFFDVEELVREKETILYFINSARDKDKNLLVRLDNLLETVEGEWDIFVIGIGNLDKGGFGDLAAKVHTLHFVLEKNMRNLNNFPYQKGVNGFFIIDKGGRVTELDGDINLEKVMRFMAGRSYQKGLYDTACQIYDNLLELNKGDLESKLGLGICSLAIEEPEAARSWFESLKSDGSILGQLGFSYISLQAGNLEAADKQLAHLAKHNDITDSSFYYLLASEVVAGKGDMDGAKRLLLNAVSAHATLGWIKAEAYNRLGLLFARSGRIQTGLTYFSRAVVENPYMMDALANKAATQWKSGQFNLAHKSYNVVLRLDRNDAIARNYIEQLKQLDWFRDESNAKEQNRVRFQTGKLAANYLRGEWKRSVRRFDYWSSKPVVIYNNGFREEHLYRTDLADGLGMALYNKVIGYERVNGVPFYKTVELGKKLALSVDEMSAHPDRIAAGFGARYYLEGTMGSKGSSFVFTVNLKNIDGDLLFTNSMPVSRFRLANPDAMFEKLAQKIVRTVIEAEPLQGKIAQADKNSDTVIINLGRRHGVKKGMELLVYKEINPAIDSNSVLRFDQKEIGEVKIIELFRDLSRAEIIYGGGFETGDKIKASDCLCNLPAGLSF